jgi:methionyl-tRNA formyltransferase
MRVAFYTNSTARDSLAVLEKLADSNQVELVQVLFYDTMGEARRSPWKILKEFGVQRVLTKAVFTTASKLRTKLAKGFLRSLIKPGSAFEFAVFRRIPFKVVNNLNSCQAQQQLRDLNLDLLIVCICKNILKDHTLSIPRLGSVNIHPSLLPKYRGPMPVFWMLYHGDSRGGVSFQRMTAKIDDGPMIAQYEATLDLRRSEVVNSQQIFELAAAKLDEVLAAIRENKDLPAQPTGPGSYFSFPTAQELSAQQKRRRS